MEPRVVLFLGAHSTITSTVTRTCKQYRDKIEKLGTSIVLAEDLRSCVRDIEPEDIEEKYYRTNPEEAKIQQALRTIHSKLDRGAEQKRALVIDESILGSSRVNLRTGQLYPTLSQRMNSLPSELDNPWHNICIAVRPYHEFFAAPYQALSNSRQFPSFKKLKNRILDVSLTWIDVIETVGARLPNASIRIWKASDSQRLRPSLERLLFGEECGVLPRRIKLDGDQNAIFSNNAARRSEDFWTQEEFEFLFDRFENHWGHLEAGWPDLIVK